MIDKDFCMSSFLTLRYIEKEDTNFFFNTKHVNFKPILDKDRILIKDEKELDGCLKKRIEEKIKNYKKVGILLSGGMDSAILASYIKGSDAYTFRFLNGEYAKEELKRAEYYAKIYELNLHYVDINFESILSCLDELMLSKGAPVHSIEPQIYLASKMARLDGVDLLLVGESADLIFGGMDQLLSKDWLLEDFKARYTFLDPKKVLKNPISMDYLFERYRVEDKIDFLSFMDDVFSIESSGSYLNSFKVAGISYFDPYAIFKMKDPLDLYRVRHGEPKYIIRELFKLKYEMEVPSKVPMPRPVDFYFKDYVGPSRREFLDNINIKELSGNQKWQLFVLERFLNLLDKQ